MVCREMRDWLGVGEILCWDAAVRGVSSTQYMLYSVCAVLGVNSGSCHGDIERDDRTSCS